MQDIDDRNDELIKTQESLIDRILKRASHEYLKAKEKQMVKDLCKKVGGLRISNYQGAQEAVEYLKSLHFMEIESVATEIKKLEEIQGTKQFKLHRIKTADAEILKIECVLCPLKVMYVLKGSTFQKTRHMAFAKHLEHNR
jgi:hypothetical protein